jgi:hypothetical protein
MPLTATATRAQLADTTRNPRKQVKGGNALGGHRVNIQLTFENLSFHPEDLFDALEAKYGSGKVASDKDTMGQGSYHFRISP